MRSILVFFFNRFTTVIILLSPYQISTVRIRMPLLVTVAKVTLMGLPSKKSGGRVGPTQLSASTSGTRRVGLPVDAPEDSDNDDYDAELSSSSSDEVWLYSCI